MAANMARMINHQAEFMKVHLKSMKGEENKLKSQHHVDSTAQTYFKKPERSGTAGPFRCKY